jgi:hypothetical protein
VNNRGERYAPAQHPAAEEVRAMPTDSPGLRIVISEMVPEGKAFLVPSPTPTRTTDAVDAERWARGVVALDLRTDPTVQHA